MTSFFDQPVFVGDEHGFNNRIEKDIVRNILNHEEVDFLTDTDHISLPNMAEEINSKVLMKINC